VISTDSGGRPAAEHSAANASTIMLRSEVRGSNLLKLYYTLLAIDIREFRVTLPQELLYADDLAAIAEKGTNGR